MNNAFKELFGPIQADEGLKGRTKAFLAEQTRGYTGAPAKRHGYPVYVAVCACLLFVLLGGRWLYFTPTAEISIDINPSIELRINRLDRVISVNGFQEEGQELSNALDIKHKNYEEAVEQILSHERIASLLSGGEVMTITVVGSDGRQSGKILSGVETCAAGQDNTYCYSALPEEVAAAHESGLSYGKYRALLELQLLDPDITPEAVQGMTMREIRDLIGCLSAGSGSNPPPHSSGGGGPHGHGGGHGNGWKSRRVEQQGTGEQQIQSNRPAAAV